MMPDLRIRECRTYFLDRYAMINAELGLVNVGLGGPRERSVGRTGLSY
jgi:hypothetical protein